MAGVADDSVNEQHSPVTRERATGGVIDGPIEWFGARDRCSLAIRPDTIGNGVVLDLMSIDNETDRRRRFFTIVSTEKADEIAAAIKEALDAHHR